MSDNHSWESEGITYGINKAIDRVAEDEGIDLSNPRRKGARIAAGSSGAMIGAALGGPVGAVIGGIFGHLIATDASYPGDDD